jgi:organic radical activating enzyme
MNKQIRTICRNLLTITGTWKWASAIRRGWLANVIRTNVYRHRCFIQPDGKIMLPHVDIYLTKSCNLKCEHCTLFNPFRSGIIPKEDVLKTIKLWSERITPKIVYLLGGEPLLHPDYDEIIIVARNSWKNSSIALITNGILLPKISDEFLKQMVDNSIEVRISRHINTENYNRNLNNSISRFKKFGVQYEIVESHKSWVSCHSLDSEGVPHSPNSSPRKAWTHCLTKECTAISGNQLCRCSVLLNLLQAVDEGILPFSEFGEVTKHKLVTVLDSNKIILRYLRGGPMKECCFCPENFENIKARQIPIEKLKQIQQIIEEKNQEYRETNTLSFTNSSTSSKFVG